MLVIKSCKVKKIQSERLINGFYKVTKYKDFINIASESSLQLTFKKLPLVEFL